MRYSISSLIVAALLTFSVQTAFAQQQNDRDLPPVKETVVTLKIQSVVQTEGEVVPQLPSAVMQYLNKQAPLVKLDVELSKREGLANMRAQYAFTSMQAYSEWRESNETQEFMRTLQNSSQDEMRFSVSMMKLPVAEYLNRFEKQ